MNLVLFLIKPSNFPWVTDQNIAVLFAHGRKKIKKTWKKTRLKWPLIRIVCARNCLWPDHPRPKWPLIRKLQDHCSAKNALETFSRQCISSAPITCVRSKMVWSEVTLVWSPRSRTKIVFINPKLNRSYRRTVSVAIRFRCRSLSLEILLESWNSCWNQREKKTWKKKLAWSGL